MRLSAIEIGTNSTKMITIESFGGKAYKVLEKSSVVNRLSSKMYERNIITDEAMDRGVGIIGDYMDEINSKDSKLVSIFSTSVLRDADNREDFKRKVKDSYGYDIEVINGEKEAYLAYKACSSHVVHEAEQFAVIDIGGGSTEIILGTKSNLNRKISLDIGAVRLTEMFINSDPIKTEDARNIVEYIKLQIKERMSFNLNGVRLIGTGGTVKTLATIHKELDFINEKDINGVVIPKNVISQILEELATKNMEERRNITGLNPKRADVIVCGLIILLTVMDAYEINEIIVSSQGVLEGFIVEYFNSENLGHASL